MVSTLLGPTTGENLDKSADTRQGRKHCSRCKAGAPSQQRPLNRVLASSFTLLARPWAAGRQQPGRNVNQVQDLSYNNDVLNVDPS